MIFITKINNNTYKVNSTLVSPADYSKLNAAEKKVFERYLKALKGRNVQSSTYSQ
jgi:hypothetical protein